MLLNFPALLHSTVSYFPRILDPKGKTLVLLKQIVYQPAFLPSNQQTSASSEKWNTNEQYKLRINNTKKQQ